MTKKEQKQIQKEVSRQTLEIYAGILLTTKHLLKETMMKLFIILIVLNITN